LVNTLSNSERATHSRKYFYFPRRLIFHTRTQCLNALKTEFVLNTI
jgi:hypothetical protein